MSDSKSKYPNNREQTMWLTQTKNGNSLAFNNIVEKYQQSIYNLCYQMLKNADDAEDAAQEVFTRAYFKLDSYNNTGKFSTWLFSIASHYCTDQLRKRHFQLISWDDLASWYRFPGQVSPQPEKTLIEALAWLAIWESERIVKQAREHPQWESTFTYLFRELFAKYKRDKETEMGKVISVTHELTDMLEAKAVEVFIDGTNKMWVNVDGKCLLRIGKVRYITIDDPNRKVTLEAKTRRSLIFNRERAK